MCALGRPTAIEAPSINNTLLGIHVCNIFAGSQAQLISISTSFIFTTYLAVYLQSVGIFSTAPRPSYLLNMADYSEGNIQDVWITSLIAARKSLREREEERGRERERERLCITKVQNLMCEDGVIDNSYHNNSHTLPLLWRLWNNSP